MTIRKAVIAVLLLAIALGAGAQSFSPTNCLLAGGQCDASNTCVRYTLDGFGFLQEQSIGTCQSSGPIVIGGQYDPPNPPPQGPYVAFVNDTRSGDRVVSAKLDAMTQGKKELGVKIYPTGKTARLRIQRVGGTRGSASFDAAGTLTALNVVNNQRITIFGGITSDAARNMTITATIDGMPVPGEFAFTVFQVNPKATYMGTDLGMILPDTALAASGEQVVAIGDGRINVLQPQHMRRLYKDAATIEGQAITARVSDGEIDQRFLSGKPDYDRAGHRTLDNLLQYGGIVFKGNIVPNVEHADFSRNIAPFSNREGFNWRRTRTIIEKKFDLDGSVVLRQCMRNQDDDSTDSDEDLIPDDGSIWVFDTPSFVIRDPNATRTDTLDGDIVRGWYTFVEWAEYGGVRVTPKVDWYWKFAHMDPEDGNLVQDDSLPGFNVIATGKIPDPGC